MRQSSQIKITTAESLIMDVLWHAARPMAAEEIHTELAEEDWTEATNRTLLSRLVNKRAVAARKDGRRFLYTPLVERADYVHAESKTLLDRLFDGQIGPFIAHFSQQQSLSDEEVAELRKLIEGLGRGR